MKLAEFRGGMASLEASPATGLSQKALVGRIVTREVRRGYRAMG